jgi:bacteriocin-like protein
MEFKELNQQELQAICGGSEASNSFMYLIGAVSKFFYYVVTDTSEQKGYSYAKCGY